MFHSRVPGDVEDAQAESWHTRDLLQNALGQAGVLQEKLFDLGTPGDEEFYHSLVGEDFWRRQIFF